MICNLLTDFSLYILSYSELGHLKNGPWSLLTPSIFMLTVHEYPLIS